MSTLKERRRFSRACIHAAGSSRRTQAAAPADPLSYVHAHFDISADDLVVQLQAR